MIRALTEAQARELAYLWSRGAVWDQTNTHPTTRQALIDKGCVRLCGDGKYRPSETGMESLTAYLYHHARIEGRVAA